MTPVAIKRAPTVDIQLPVEQGYAPFKLAFDFKAICEVKDMTGTSLLNGDTWDKIDDDPKLFCAVVWAGLQLYHPQLTFEEVQHMLLPGDLADLMTAVLKAWTMVSPKQVEKADPKIEPTTEPTSVQQ